MEDILIDLLVIEVDDIRMEVFVIKLLNILEGRILYTVLSGENVPNGAFDHFQSRETQNIKLDKAHGLQVSNILTF